MKRFKTILSAIAVAGMALHSHANTTFDSQRTDFRDETIYFAITTRFYDGDPMNNVLCWDGQADQIANGDPCWRGDFKGLIDKLDYIKALGFTAIWITPIVQNASGFDYHGYHAMDFSKVDLRYESHISRGSASDVTFQSLIDAAHAKGMKIILDIVLNHTGNFGEAHFAKLFERDPNIRNQANISYALIPDAEKLGSDYNNISGNEQYNRRFKYLKNTNGQNLDTHNYWHHIGTDWNWDIPARWWGQIAGDCVDLNTENPAVADYLVQCYGEFIKMGVDGFRIDTSGHISRLTFNKEFIPAFTQLGEQYKDKRLNGCPFFMYGEVCSRYSEPQYRGQDNLSSYFYTWKSDASLLNQWNEDATWWDNQVLLEGCQPTGNMLLCLEETTQSQRSENVFMKNGKWHEPDYSEASGFNVIDFPMHYNFNNADAAISIANKGDKMYNDASFNVVYVDSHDYCPGPNDGVRFNGGTEQWAENLSLMFTFRGIPCIYYGSEVEFQKGKTIDKGPDLALKNSGRAYYGAYLEGEVNATDFGQYTASGQVAETLNSDLAHHIRRLNLIRAAVPALRKGQYTFEGVSGNNKAFKRAYKDSYALVCINGGATFKDIPDGNYTDVVTGDTYTPVNGAITVNAPNNKGQLRVLVKDWTGGKIGYDGKFIYGISPVQHGGNVTVEDPGTTFYYGKDDVIERAAVKLNPEGGVFRTETLTITAQLNETAVSGWYAIGNGQHIEIFPNSPAEFTIGQNMSYDENVTISYGAKAADGTENTGKAVYKKVDPNATITIYVKSSIKPNLYVWKDDAGVLNGDWPGKAMSSTLDIDGVAYYYQTFAGEESINIILNHDNKQTADIKGITSDKYIEYNGGTTYKMSDKPLTGGGSDPSGDYSYTIYWDNSNSVDWSTVKIYVYGNGADDIIGSWNDCPVMAYDEKTGYYKHSFSVNMDLNKSNVIFHNKQGKQTGDNVAIRNNGIYRWNGDRADCFTGDYVEDTSGIGTFNEQDADIKIRIHNGAVYVTSDKDTVIKIVRADGTYRNVRINKGINILEGMERGFYIINNTKVML